MKTRENNEEAHEMKRRVLHNDIDPLSLHPIAEWFYQASIFGPIHFHPQETGDYRSHCGWDEVLAGIL